MKYIFNLIEKKTNLLTIIVVLSTFIFLMLPFLMHGENSIITIHDNLDQFVSYYRFFKINDLFFSFNKSTVTLGGMSTLYFTYASSYNLNSLTYLLFDTFDAYILTYFIHLLIGFISMLLLLKYSFNEKSNIFVIVIVSLSFSVLPVIPFWQLGSSSVPLIIYLFLKIYKGEPKKINYKVALIILFPLVSFFAIYGVFILPIWFLGILYSFYKNKTLNYNLILGFVVLLVGYTIVDFQFFYYVLSPVTLNRAAFDQNGSIFELIISFYRNIFYGQYHGSTFQNMIILPSLIFGFVAFNFGSKRDENKYKIYNYLFLLFILLSFLYALYNSNLINSYVNVFFPIISGFNWGRIYFFNQVILYFLFTMVLLYILKLNIMFKRAIVFIILVSQLGYILISPVEYNDSVKNIYQPLFLGREDTLTYKEFYSEELFNEIKQYLNYNNEVSLAFGYHPSVLMYNNISSLDGYMNSYPLDYKINFRKLLEPEFEYNYRDRDYFDSWGGRLYLYNSIVSYQPTREIPDEKVELKIDIDHFVKLNGKYIFSLYPFSNTEELNITLLGVFSNEASLYTLYVYEV